MKNYTQFHDGSFDGFVVDGPSVSIFVRTKDQDRYVFKAKGAVALAAGGLMIGNIIFEVVTRNAEEITLHDIAIVYGVQKNDSGETYAAKMLEAAREHKLTVIEINPSYGGTCLALAQSIDLIPCKAAECLAIAN